MIMAKVNNSMNLAACVGLTATTVDSIRSSIHVEHDRVDSYAGHDFFENENFRAALERMNGGEY